jgi:hypothetical protein
MKKLLLIFSFVALYSISKAQNPAWLWAESSNGSQYEYGEGVVTDTAGNFFIGGRLGGMSTLGGEMVMGMGENNPVIGKFDSSGSAIWLNIHTYSGGYDYLYGLCTDNNNNVYATGNISSGSGIYIEKYNNSGAMEWNPTAGAPSGSAITTDNSGYIYVVGDFGNYSSVTFGRITVNNPGNGAFIVKMDSSGNFIWVKTISSTSGIEPGDILADNSGNLFIIGSYSGTAAFGAIAAPASSGISNFFIAKYDTAGNALWLTSATNAGMWGSQETRGVVVDNCDNVYVTGMFENTATFGSFSLKSAGDEDMFVGKLLNNGNWEWVNSAGGAGRDHGFSIALDKNYDVYVGGDYGQNSGTGITFGNDLSFTGTGTFVAKYDNGTGTPIWAQVGGVANTDHIFGMNVDKWGYVYITGEFSNSTIYGTANLSCTAVSNTIIAKLDTVPVRKISPVISGAYCLGSSIDISYNISGAFNTGNTFTMELSDSNGSFINNTVIGSVTSSMSGTIYATIPSNISPGSNYKVRIVSSDPQVSSYAGCPGIVVAKPLNVSVSPLETSTCTGGSVYLSASGGTNYLWSNGDTTSSIIVKPGENTTYYVTVTSGTCSSKDSSSITVITPPNKPTFYQHGDTLTSSSKTNNQWYMNGLPINGDTSQNLIIYSTSPNEYYVVVNNEANGCSTSSDTVTTTGINQVLTINNQLSIYPNPFNNDIIIKINSLALDVKEWNLEIIDVLGRPVYSEQSLNYNNNIDLSNLSSGVYFITVINKTVRAVFPMVKQN